MEGKRCLFSWGHPREISTGFMNEKSRKETRLSKKKKQKKKTECLQVNRNNIKIIEKKKKFHF